ncbi:replication protein [Pseudomonas luteola]|uniref:replication protein n=1 Tax=Pseudomonas luteola TaxID=47886 RepID=UPI002897E7ED|nr:replication protein [Pseudomonas luteola]
MTNVIQLSKSQGFTRMDNDLYEALIGADLSGRELRVALAIHRLTIGFNTQTSRIAASVIAKLSGIHADNVSRIISELLRQRVIFRTGGSRSPIGISPVSEWKIDAQNDDKSNLIKAGETVVFDRSRLSKTTDYKDSKDITNSNELVTPAKSSVISKPKAKTAKPATGIKKLLADNPHGASEKILTEYLAVRKAKRAPITDTVWASINTELGILASHGLSADESLAVAIKAAWQGFESEWVLNRMRRSAPLVRQSNEPDFDSVEWANDLGEW